VAEEATQRASDSSAAHNAVAEALQTLGEKEKAAEEECCGGTTPAAFGKLKTVDDEGPLEQFQLLCLASVSKYRFGIEDWVKRFLQELADCFHRRSFKRA
jgi:hypothetical protein